MKSWLIFVKAELQSYHDSYIHQANRETLVKFDIFAAIQSKTHLELVKHIPPFSHKNISIIYSGFIQGEALYKLAFRKSIVFVSP